MSTRDLSEGRCGGLSLNFTNATMNQPLKFRRMIKKIVVIESSFAVSNNTYKSYRPSE
jgi:hypothetical protein